MSDLTDKQKRFVQEYLIDLNATQAAIRAGYSEKTARFIGHENLTKPNIQSLIEQKQKKIEEKTGVTIEWVIAELVDTYDHCRQKVAVLDHEGNETGEWKFEPGSAVRSLELLGKHLGMFKEKVEITGKDGKQIEIHTSTTAADRFVEGLAEENAKLRAPQQVEGDESI